MLDFQITEKSADGWWTGRIEGKVGVFPASFVEMIEIPRNKDERKKLLKRFQQGRLGQDNQNDVTPGKHTQDHDSDQLIGSACACAH